jgi:hypothetical protein
MHILLCVWKSRSTIDEFFLKFLIFVINNVELSCIDDELNLKVTMDENTFVCIHLC